MAGRIACFGEIMLRMTAPGRELLLQRPHLDVYVGGAEANVAVALAELGHQTLMVTALPDDPLGEHVVRHLRSHGVDVGHVRRAAGRMGLYFVSQGAGARPPAITYDRAQSSFALAQAEDFDWGAILEGVDLLHLSGITPALGEASSRAAEAAAEAAEQRGVAVCFDGNYRAQLWQQRATDPAPILRRLVDKAQIMFGNHRDISLLLGREFHGDGPQRRREAAEAAFAAFPNLKLIASTARRVEDSERHHIAARIDTPDDMAQSEERLISGIVDRIGTGDAFAAGVLHGLRTANGKLEAVLEAGLALTILKHSISGDASYFGPADLAAAMGGSQDVRR